ncbi:hypothetical protein [Ruegeria sp. HKCCD7318]|nr:hypothetical protein [Ruegeria sp. HKCCD7318]
MTDQKLTLSCHQTTSIACDTDYAIIAGLNAICRAFPSEFQFG